MNQDRLNGSPLKAKQKRARAAVAIIAGLFILLSGLGRAGTTEIEIGGPFMLTDQNGQTRTDRDFRGSYMLIYFGFTFCPDMCPTALLKMTDALTTLEKREGAKAAQVVPIFITVDPQRDTPAILKDYAAHFSPRLVALTGSAEAVRKVANPYGAFFAKVPTDSETYLIDHTGFIYLMGPDGRYVTHFEKDVTVDDLVSSLINKVEAPALLR